MELRDSESTEEAMKLKEDYAKTITTMNQAMMEDRIDVNSLPF